ncbi:MAG: hypothetical protein D6743_08095, partial [Calditrichaeota bacterium]
MDVQTGPADGRITAKIGMIGPADVTVAATAVLLAGISPKGLDASPEAAADGLRAVQHRRLRRRRRSRERFPHTGMW